MIFFFSIETTHAHQIRLRIQKTPANSSVFANIGATGVNESNKYFSRLSNRSRSIIRFWYLEVEPHHRRRIPEWSTFTRIFSVLNIPWNREYPEIFLFGSVRNRWKNGIPNIDVDYCANTVLLSQMLSLRLTRPHKVRDKWIRNKQFETRALEGRVNWRQGLSIVRKTAPDTFNKSTDRAIVHGDEGPSFMGDKPIGYKLLWFKVQFTLQNW